MAPLSRDLTQAQIDLVDLLTAMYPGDNELVIDSSTFAVIDKLRAWCNGDDVEDGRHEDLPQEQQIQNRYPINVIAKSISLELNIQLEQEPGKHDVSTKSASPSSIQMNIEIPLHLTNDYIEETSASAPLPVHRVRQPSWMNKAKFIELSASLAEHEDLFDAIEYVRAYAAEFANNAQSTSQQERGCIETQTRGLNDSRWSVQSRSDHPLTRVWFYFPSLSTREKRNDLVNHAPRFGLTGFVLAGKPGLLCIEGISENIDAYMKFIKTDSWGDIPSHQKKVSERYREELDSRADRIGDYGKPTLERVFPDMSEITGLLGEKRGERANRGDMKALENWLNEKGLGEAFAKVLL